MRWMEQKGKSNLKVKERGRERHHTTRDEGEEHGPAAAATMATVETMVRTRRMQRRKAGEKRGGCKLASQLDING
jgi:hypothetical protein